MDKAKKISSKRFYERDWFKLDVDQVEINNGTFTREVLRHPGATCIIGVVDNQIIMEHQHRYPIDEVILELPAGKLDPNEEVELCAKRELQEETGYVASKLEKLGAIYPAIGYSDEIIHIYLATDLVKDQVSFDDDESIDIELMSLAQIKALISNGTIKDAKTISAIYYYEEHLKNSYEKEASNK